VNSSKTFPQLFVIGLQQSDFWSHPIPTSGFSNQFYIPLPLGKGKWLSVHVFKPRHGSRTWRWNIASEVFITCLLFVCGPATAPQHARCCSGTVFGLTVRILWSWLWNQGTQEGKVRHMSKRPTWEIKVGCAVNHRDKRDEKFPIGSYLASPPHPFFEVTNLSRSSGSATEEGWPQRPLSQNGNWLNFMPDSLPAIVNCRHHSDREPCCLPVVFRWERVWPARYAIGRFLLLWKLLICMGSKGCIGPRVFDLRGHYGAGTSTIIACLDYSFLPIMFRFSVIW
jgi:hypothetical protein